MSTLQAAPPKPSSTPTRPSSTSTILNIAAALYRPTPCPAYATSTKPTPLSNTHLPISPLLPAPSIFAKLPHGPFSSLALMPECGICNVFGGYSLKPWAPRHVTFCREKSVPLEGMSMSNCPFATMLMPGVRSKTPGTVGAHQFIRLENVWTRRTQTANHSLELHALGT